MESVLGPGTQSLGHWGRVERPVIAQSCTAASGHLGPSPPLLAPSWQDQPFYWRTLAIWPRRFGRLQQRSFLQWVLENQSMFCFAAESVLPRSTLILPGRPLGRHPCWHHVFLQSQDCFVFAGNDIDWFRACFVLLQSHYYHLVSIMFFCNPKTASYFLATTLIDSEHAYFSFDGPRSH